MGNFLSSNTNEEIVTKDEVIMNSKFLSKSLNNISSVIVDLDNNFEKKEGYCDDSFFGVKNMYCVCVKEGEYSFRNYSSDYLECLEFIRTISKDNIFLINEIKRIGYFKNNNIEAEIKLLDYETYDLDIEFFLDGNNNISAKYNNLNRNECISKTEEVINDIIDCSDELDKKEFIKEMRNNFLNYEDDVVENYFELVEDDFILKVRLIRK